MPVPTHGAAVRFRVVVQIVGYVAVAAAAGVLADVGPARSAARVDVLEAVVSD